MPRLASLLYRGLFILTLAAIGVSALPTGVVFAAGRNRDPLIGLGRDYAPRLERIFGYQQQRLDHQTKLLARIPTFVERIQGLIDRATDKGFDASAVQTALDDFSGALPAAQAAHDQAGALIAARAGFDENSKVTDAAAALKTVTGIHDAFRVFVDTLLPPFLSLREAIHTFVDQNDLRRKLAPGETARP